MKIHEIRSLEEATRRFGLGTKMVGEPREVGRAGWFRIWVPTGLFDESTEQALVTIAKDDAEKSTTALMHMGMPAQRMNLVIVPKAKMGENKLVSRSANAGLASRQGHGIAISDKALRVGQGLRVISHEWGHMYWFQLPKQERDKIISEWQNKIANPKIDAEKLKIIKERAGATIKHVLASEISSGFGATLDEIEKVIVSSDPKMVYLQTANISNFFTGKLKSGVKVADRHGQYDASPGDQVMVSRTMASKPMWQIVNVEGASGFSRILSPKMVMELVDFDIPRDKQAQIEDLASRGSAAVVSLINDWEKVVGNIAAQINPRTGDDREARITMATAGLDEFTKVFLQRALKAKDLRGIINAMVKTFVDRMDPNIFHEEASSKITSRLGSKRGMRAREKAEESGKVHSAYGASNPSEFWATLVEKGALGQLDVTGRKLLMSVAR
jgi:hypothetical protein